MGKSEGEDGYWKKKGVVEEIEIGIKVAAKQMGVMSMKYEMKFFSL